MEFLSLEPVGGIEGEFPDGLGEDFDSVPGSEGTDEDGEAGLGIQSQFLFEVILLFDGKAIWSEDFGIDAVGIRDDAFFLDAA